jgi:hypothetical protein
MGRGAYVPPKVREKADEEALGFLRSFAANAADPLGIPSYLVGTISPSARDAWRGVQAEGNVISQVGGGLAAPIGIAGSGLKALTTAAPKTATGIGALWGATGSPSKLNATEKPSGREQDALYTASRGNPALEALYSQIEAKDLESKAPVKGVNRESSDKVRDAARQEASTLRQKLIDEITRLNPPKQSFEDAYPEASQNLALLQAGAGLGLGALVRGGGKLASHLDMLPWNRAVSKAEKAIASGDAANAHRFAQKASSHMDDYDKWGSRAARLGSEALPPLAGGVVGTEVAMYPHQYNLRNAPEDSAEYAAAKKALGDDLLYTAGRGALMGTLGGFTGAHLAPIPGARAPISETKALLNRYSDDYANDASRMARSIAADNAPIPLVRVPETQALPRLSTSDTPLPPLPSDLPAIRGPRIPSKDPEVPTPSRKGKKSSKEREEKDVSSSTPEQREAATSELRGFFGNKPEPFARGGSVDSVHTGPLVSDVAGRTDHLAISVPAGAYVVPADIVSGLGEGNTSAGLKVVEQMFPSQPPSRAYAAGGKVPIMAAGGEHVLSPEQVAEIGGGDLDLGHSILDEWVRSTRAHTIETLKRLPGPAQG